MKRYTRVRAYATMSALVFAIMPTGCLTVNVDASTKTTTDDHAVRELVGPDHSANVKLGDADHWIVPPLIGEADAAPVVWTLGHPDEHAVVVVRRECGPQEEPFLWLSDPPNWNGSSALATLGSCGQFGEVYGTVILEFDGTAWIGISATGNASLLPPG